jgi:hypothetical protein
VPVRRIFFSEKERCGIGTFVPSDPKSQDIAELVGSIDLSTIGDYGSESDPRAYRFDGELNVANRDQRGRPCKNLRFYPTRKPESEPTRTHRRDAAI